MFRVPAAANTNASHHRTLNRVQLTHYKAIVKRRPWVRLSGHPAQWKIMRWHHCGLQRFPSLAGEKKKKGKRHHPAHNKGWPRRVTATSGWDLALIWLTFGTTSRTNPLWNCLLSVHNDFGAVWWTGRWTVLQVNNRQVGCLPDTAAVVLLTELCRGIFLLSVP